MITNERLEYLRKWVRKERDEYGFPIVERAEWPRNGESDHDH
jgi:hypothetical protein